MLQKIGDKLQGQRWLSFSILFLLAILFAAWGAYGIVDFTSGGGNYAAKVNGEEIRADDVNRAWQQQQPQLARMFNGEIPAEQREALQSRLIDGFVREKVVAQRAEKMGFRATDAQVVRAFQSEQAFQVDGKFDAMAAKARLAQAGISESAYVADQRRQLAMNQLAGAVGATDFLTAKEIQRVQTLRGEQRELRFALLTPQQFGAGPAPGADAIEAYYKAHERDFLTTESVKLAYAELSLADVAAKVIVSDAQLREKYAATRENYVEAERRHARHILVKDKAEADAVYAQVSGGKDFAALAKEKSQDPGSASQGGDLGWADRNAYVPEFTAALFELKAGEVSKPVKTQFGYHVIKLEAVEAGKSRGFDEVKGEIEAQLKRDMAGDRFGEIQEQLQQRLDKGAGGFDELVKEFGLKAGSVERFERGAGGAPLGGDAALNELVLGDRALNQRAVVGPVAQGEENILIAKVLEHHPPVPKPLAQVRDSIVAALVRERGSEAARKAAEAALARLTAGETFDKVAADLKLRSDPARKVSRSSTDLPVQVRAAAFAGLRPAEGKPVLKAVPLDEGGVALLAVTGVRLPRADDDATSQGVVAQAEVRRHGMAETEAYVAELIRTAKIKKNLKVFN
ncbi:MAG: hypothetical protein RLZZ200_24 [Pseudomonadota bacterium]|jgi:peptidyl-prolyl cis-trans isomerase D